MKRSVRLSLKKETLASLAPEEMTLVAGARASGALGAPASPLLRRGEPRRRIFVRVDKAAPGPRA